MYLGERMPTPKIGFSSGAIIGALAAAALLGGAWFAFLAPKTAQVAPKVVANTAAPAQMPANHPPMGGGTVMPAGAQGPAQVHGQVLEVLQVPSYTYLRLKTSGGEVWAAVPTVAVAEGATVGIANASTMTGFFSKSLDRTFDEILFGSLAAQ
jgi:hypothetical protein